MSTTDSIWGIADVCMVTLYLCAVVAAVRFLWPERHDCFACTFREAWLRSGVLAFLVTPSLVGDFWLFTFPGPAALGFALLSPGVLFASGHRLDILSLVLMLYVLPWMACTALIFYVWRFMRWRRLGRDCA
jgi:hypothetical protein